MEISNQDVWETEYKVQRLPEEAMIVDGSMSQSKLFENLSQYELRSALYGTVLGDSTIRVKEECINPILQIVHHPKYRDYMLVKGQIFGQIPGIKFTVIDVIHTNHKTGKQYPQIRAFTTTNKWLLKPMKRFYKPKKQITKGILESLTPLGIALWYMDDGHLGFQYNQARYTTDAGKQSNERTISTRTVTLHTEGYTEQENILISKWLLERYGVESKIHSSHTRNLYFIWMNTTNSRKFVDIIRPYVLAVPSMHYKIDFKYRTDSIRHQENASEFLRFNIGYWTTEKRQECAVPQLIGAEI